MLSTCARSPDPEFLTVAMLEPVPDVESLDDDVQPAFSSLVERLRSMVIGQEQAVEHIIIALIADGHVLLQGAPGLAKTRIARLFAGAFEGVFRRIQFTPDLLPSDLVGGHIYNSSEQRFDFQPGPVFANFILADEINRAPAKVQSALLEAMEERQVTSGQTSFRLESPFLVIATQNPIEHEGTWDLPHAQLDRFLLQVNLDYPAYQVERGILDLAVEEARDSYAGGGDVTTGITITRQQVYAVRSAAAEVYLSDAVRGYIVRLIAASRGRPAPVPGVAEHLSHPASPRGSIMLARAAQARAWLYDRDHVLPEDVQTLAPDVLRHRIGLNYRAEADGIEPDSVIRALLDAVDVV